MADEEKTITTVFKADISDFGKSAQDLNRYVKQVDSEFNKATASMGRWSDNTDGLKAKLTQLNGTLKAEETKLDDLNARYADLVKQGKENTKQAQSLATSINNQNAKVTKIKGDIERYTGSLKELEDAGVSTKKELDELTKKNEEFKQSLKDMASGVFKGAVVGLAGIGTAITGVMAGMNNLVNETAELRTQMGMLETSFTQNGHNAETATKTYNELFGVLGDSGKATEASLHLSQFAKTEEELADMTDVLTGVYAKFGDSLPLESLAEGISVTSSLGVVSGSMADALEFSGESVEAFNEELAKCNSEEERSQLITEKLNELYGESAEKYKELNKDVIDANKATADYNQAVADIATVAQPIVTQFKTVMVEVLQSILAKFQEVDLETLIGNISNAIKTMVDVVLPPLMSVLTWVLDNLSWLAPLLGTIVGLVGGLTLAFKAYNAIALLVKATQTALNFVMNANPIGLIITAVGLLVVAFTTLWNKCEGFRNFWINLWDGIKSVGKSAINGIISFFEKGLNAIIGFINKITDGLSKVWEWAGIAGIPSIPTANIPRLARGGVVDEPTLAQIGEAGKEVVMPLEQNTGWIRQLAKQINVSGGGGGNTYNINQNFAGMETTALAQHRANLELRRMLSR